MVYIIPEKVNLTITLIGATFCLCPLFALNYDNSYTTNDEVEMRGNVGDLLDRHVTLLASLFVILIPFADLMLDVPFHVASYFNSEQSSKNVPESNVVVRLTDCERFFFIMGVAVQSSLGFVPLQTDINTVAVIYNCTNNFTSLLVLAPIVIFLGRCTTTFSSLKACVILSLASMGLFLLTISLFFGTDVPAKGITLSGHILVSIAGLLYLGGIFYCFFNYLSDHSLRLSIISLFSRSMKGGKGSPPEGNSSSKILNNEVASSDRDNELYTNHVPALHMISSLIIAFANIYVLYSPGRSVTSAFDQKSYLVILAEIVVLVTELRIRKNEVARGLIALLASKKSYVRYISHELRTPLNTAFLGLKLLTTDLKSSKASKDVDRYDTLCDVNMSCMAAVDILNDLLCYEKLESGILELHREEVAIVPFLTESVSMFAAQARECAVTLTLVSNGTPFDRLADTPPSPLSISPSDFFYADKFKMDQVIRNVVSNALKFTPSGGAVTVSAAVVLDTMSENSNTSTQCALTTGTGNRTGNSTNATVKVAGRSSSWRMTRKAVRRATGETVVESSRSSLTTPRNRLNSSDDINSFSGVNSMNNSSMSNINTSMSNINNMSIINTSSTNNLNNLCLSIDKESVLGGYSHNNKPSRPRQRQVVDSYIGSNEKGNTVGNTVGNSTANSMANSIAPNSLASSYDSVNCNVAGKLVVVVTDNGAGISAENQKRLFKDIVQFSPEKLQAGGGSGLGLWITGGIVDLHGGKISVYSRGEGTGSSFTLEMPMMRVAGVTSHTLVKNDKLCESGQLGDNDDRPTILGLSRRFQSAPELCNLCPDTGTPMTYEDLSPHTKRIPIYDMLVVDDSRLNRKMLMKCLQSDNHICTEAQDGLEALAKVKERMDLVSRGIGKHYDAILMDFIMPNMDGPTATRAIRDLGYTAPIFGVTGNGLPTDVSLFLSCGADRVLLKPLDIEAFKRAMDEVC